MDGELSEMKLSNALSLQVQRLREENNHLRRLLWIRHGCTTLYGDDGEMQCSTCQIDFLRDKPQDIEKWWFDMAMDQFLKDHR